MLASAAVATYGLLASIRPCRASAVRILRVLAGASGTWALHAARTLPVERSVTIHAVARSAGGRATPPGTDTCSPGCASCAPPSADAGGGSGTGADVPVLVEIATAVAHGGGGGSVPAAAASAGVAVSSVAVSTGTAISDAVIDPAAPTQLPRVIPAG